MAKCFIYLLFLLQHRHCLLLCSAQDNTRYILSILSDFYCQETRGGGARRQNLAAQDNSPKNGKLSHREILGEGFLAITRETELAQLYGHSRQGGTARGVCQGISIGPETPAIPKQFISQFNQNYFLFKKIILVITVVDTPFFSSRATGPVLTADMGENTSSQYRQFS